MYTHRMRIPTTVVLSLALLFGTGAAFAAAPVTDTPAAASSEEQPAKAVITGPDDIAVGRTIILDASSSTTTGGEKTEYRWFIEEPRQTISRSVEAIYTPEKPGTLIFHLVIRTVSLTGQVEESETTHTVVVYNRKIAMIVDDSVPPEKIVMHSKAASEENIFLRVVSPASASTPLRTDDPLTEALSEQRLAIANAETIVVWTRDGISGLQALVNAVQNDPERLSGIHNQSIVVITDRSLTTLARTARGPFSSLQPSQMILTRNEAINPLLLSATMDEFKGTLAQRDIDSLTITSGDIFFRPWDVLSALVNYMLTHGVSSQTVLLLLMLPVIATILAFLKQVIGITTFGLYTPSIIALSFLALGWWVGLLFLTFIVATGYVTRSIMKRWRLLYIPKVAIVLTVVSFTLMILLGIGTLFSITFSRDTVFILLIMSSLTENFLSMKTEQGWRSAIMGIGETVLASLLCVFIVQWSPLQSFILAYPEVILLTIVVNVFLGRWTGLRLLEYIRFREVFRHLQEE